MNGIEARAEKVADLVEEKGLSALLVTDLIDIRWLTGFGGSNAACICGPGLRLFLTDFRYEAAVRETLPGWQIEIVRGDWIEGIARSATEGIGTDGRIGFQHDHMTVKTFDRLQEAFGKEGGFELKPAGEITARLRRVKDEGEIEAIATAAEFADEIYSATIERGLTGRSESEVARFALALMRERGAEPSFPPIVAAGPNGALPHAEPSDRQIEPGDLVVFDMGVELGGICSDCTRTFAAGREPEPEAVEVYRTTLVAQEAGLDAIRAGIEGSAVDAAARSVIAEAGYGDHFGHGLGHGVGLEVHEAPRLSPLSKDTLMAGEVVTVEPGIYLPGRFGVRIEDLVVVTEKGYRNLSGLPKELTVVD